MTMGDRIAIMNEGILQQIGTPDEIYFRPSNIFVAGFIGSPPTNFFDCTLSEDGALNCKEFTYQLPRELTEAMSKSGAEDFVLGVRPQDTLVSKKTDEKRNHIKVTVEVVEPIGDQTILDLKVGDALVKAVVSPDFKTKTGDEFWITFSTDKIHIFDRKTGKTLV